MLSLRLTAPLLALPLLLGACAAESISHANSIDGVTTKAEYRLITTGYRAGTAQKITCAEPSPDAMKAFSMALSGGLSNVAAAAGGATNTTAATAALALQNSLAEIGVRTATIQMLRDGLHRACEAYMNGALDKEEYMVLLAHYPRTMATVMAIEALGYGQFPSKATIGATAEADLPTIDTSDPAKPKLSGGSVKVTPAAPDHNAGQRAQASADAIRDILLTLYKPENDPLLGSCAMALASKNETDATGKTIKDAFKQICTGMFSQLAPVFGDNLKASAMERQAAAAKALAAASRTSVQPKPATPVKHDPLTDAAKKAEDAKKAADKATEAAKKAQQHYEELKKKSG